MQNSKIRNSKILVKKWDDSGQLKGPVEVGYNE